MGLYLMKFLQPFYSVNGLLIKFSSGKKGGEGEILREFHTAFRLDNSVSGKTYHDFFYLINLSLIKY